MSQSIVGATTLFSGDECGDSVIFAIDTWSHDQLIACGHVTGCQSGSDKVLLVSVESPFDLAAAPGVVYSPSHTG